MTQLARAMDSFNARASRDLMPAARSSSSSLVALPFAALDEAQLVAGILEKNPKAVAQLYDTYAPLIRGLLARTLGGSRDVDDLAQDTFMTVISRCEAIRDPSALRSFVVGVTFRVARNHLRKRALRRFLALEEVSEPEVAARDPEAVERVRHVYEALDKLDTDSRVAFVARYVEGYELAEAAEVCDCSLATFKRRLARAEKRFEALSRGDPVLQAMFGSPGRAS